MQCGCVVASYDVKYGVTECDIVCCVASFDVCCDIITVWLKLAQEKSQVTHNSKIMLFTLMQHHAPMSHSM